MKTRIIKHTALEDVWYTVEYKQLLLWRTWKDTSGWDARYRDLDRARLVARNLTTKEIKEVVK